MSNADNTIYRHYVDCRLSIISLKKNDDFETVINELPDTMVVDVWDL